MDLVQSIIERAKSNKQRIVLPEATEERTLRAADKAVSYTHLTLPTNSRV